MPFTIERSAVPEKRRKAAKRRARVVVFFICLVSASISFSFSGNTIEAQSFFHVSTIDLDSPVSGTMTRYLDRLVAADVGGNVGVTLIYKKITEFPFLFLSVGISMKTLMKL